MNNILNTILKDTYTLSQLKHRLRILKAQLISSLFGGASPTLTSYDLTWLKSLPDSFYQSITRDNIYQIFDQLEAQVNKLTLLVIYLPFEANDQTLSAIGSFARQTFANPFLCFEVKFDPNLIAGAALAWKGVYKDYSLRAKIEERKDEILEGFKKFLR